MFLTETPGAGIALPSRKLPAGRYRVDVRLASGVNPGPLTRRRSPFLTVG